MERVNTNLGCSERMERFRERPIREEQPNDRGTNQQRTTSGLALQKCSKSLLRPHRRIVSRARYLA
jgi:hypothetical protein